MGPSGCGKTTLLDALSGQRPIDSGSTFNNHRASKDYYSDIMFFSGSIKLNKERLSKKWRRKICYVLQQDIFFAELTLRETLEYTGKYFRKTFTV